MAQYAEISIQDVFENYDLSVSIEFYINNGNCYVSLFEVKLIILDTTKSEQYIRAVASLEKYGIETNVAVFSNKDLYEKQGLYKIRNISYSSFIPSGYEIEFIDDDETKFKDEIKFKEVFRFDGIKAILKDFFAGLNYIGPERNGPQEDTEIQVTT